MFNDVYSLLIRELDRERFRRMSLEISARERGFCYRDFKESARYCYEQFRTAGLAKTEIMAHPADGVSQCLDFIMPQAWDVDGAMLSVASPAIDDPVLADRRLDPMCVANRCPATPRGGITAEVVTWEAMCQGAEVRGKLVFGRFTLVDWGQPLVLEVIERGAAGLISGASDAEDEAPLGTPWINGWGFPYWYHAKGDPIVPCFVLSPSQARRLAALLRKHETVTLKAVVDSKTYDGEIDTITGVLPGREAREITLLGHIYEPFVPDDATAAAAIIEIGRLLSRLTAEGALPPLKRTVRLLLGMEQYGMACFFADEARRAATLTAVNMDAICYDPHATGVPVTVCMSPHALPFAGDFLLREMAEAALADYPWRATYKWADNDNFLSDSAIGIPTSWVVAPPGKLHHNSRDCLDRLVDWELAYRVTCLVGAYAYALATVDGDDLSRLLRLVSRGARMEILRQAEALDEAVRRGELDGAIAAERLHRHAEWQQERTRSMRRIEAGVDTGGACLEIEVLAEAECRRFAASKPAAKRALSKWERAAKNTVVRRVGVWFPASEARVPPAERFLHIAGKYEILNWCNGERDLLEALALCECETGREVGDEDIERVLHYMEQLERYGYVELTYRKRPSAGSAAANVTEAPCNHPRETRSKKRDGHESR